MWKPRHTDPIETQATTLLAECDAILAGAAAEFLVAAGRWAPPWAWLNSLAHASREELEAAVAMEPARRPGEALDTGEWRAAQTFLAGEILSYIDDAGTDLAELQRTTLVPLELELIRSPSSPSLRPGQLAFSVMSAVHRNASRRSR